MSGRKYFLSTALIFWAALHLMASTASAAGPAFVSACSNQNGLSANSIACTLSPTAGNILAVYVGWINTNSMTLSDTCNSGGSSDTYTYLGNPTPFLPGGASSGLGYSRAGKTGSCTITATFSGVQSGNFITVQEISGVNTTTPVDVYTIGTQGYTVQGTNTISASTTTTVANDYIFAAVVDYSNGSVYTAGTISLPYTIPPGAATTNIASEYALQSIGGAVTATFTNDAPGYYNTGIIAFEPAVIGPPDTTSPSVPTGFTGTVISASEIDLSWTASTDPDNTANQISYTIYRNGTKVAVMAAGALSYHDTGLAASTTYSYTISAQDPAANSSAQSQQVSATTQAAPFDFVISNAGNVSVVQGSSTSNTITATLSSGATQVVIFSGSGQPTSASLSFTQASCSPTCSTVVTITTTGSTPVGNYTITIKGTASTTSHTTSFTLFVSAAGQNPIVTENQNPGTSQWQIPYGSSSTDSSGQIKGYASATSVNKGQSITFYVSVNPVQTYTIDVYRMGWYQGLGGRLMQHIGPLNGGRQAVCPTDATTGMIECRWAASYTLATQTTWTSGIYLALLINAQGWQNYIVFCVRDDSRVAALLYQQPVTTYQAYNDYPYDNSTGKGLYAFNSFGANTISGGPNAVKVSFDRPYMGDGSVALYSQSFLSWEVAFVRWVEKSGYDVTYATDIDTHVNGAMLLNYRGIIFPGHDEYWSKQMYDAATNALAAGVNLGFFSADSLGWQIRLESSSSGVANRVVVCYRDSTIDPISDPTLKTVMWRDPPVNRPEQALIGVQYTAQVPWHSQTSGWANYVVQNNGNWVYAGTGFRNGDQVPSIVGYEADRVFTQYPLPNAVSGTYTVLSQSPLGNGGPSDFGNSSVYQAPSGAWVFAAGTIAWGMGLDNGAGGSFVDSRIQQMTANIFNRFISPTH